MICISKDTEELKARIALPASKSISNRLLILRHHYTSGLKIHNLSRADDTVLLSQLLQILKQHEGKEEQGILKLDARNAGTVFRFLTALLSVTRGHYYLTGSDRMKQRPIAPLVDALRSIGADIEYPENPGFPPLLIRGRKINGGRLYLDSSQSSQFLSALLLVAPMMTEGLVIDVSEELVSRPYVYMTLKLMQAAGIMAIHDNGQYLVMPQETIRADLAAEPDWSGASFWYLMLSMAGKGEVFFPGLHLTGLQGDEELARYFRPLGIETTEDEKGILIEAGHEVFMVDRIDFSGHPDLALPVMLAYGAARVPADFTGLDSLRLKESDRLFVIEREFNKVGLGLLRKPGNLWSVIGNILPGQDHYIEDDDDHRVAMTFAGLAVKGFHVFVENADVVGKSYPGFWKDLEYAGFIVKHPC